MKTVNTPVEFLGTVAEYIKAASDQTSALEAEVASLKTANASLKKVASEKTASVAQPAISLELAKTAAQKLVTAGLLSAEHLGAVAESFHKDPVKLVDALSKVAEHASRKSLGAPEKTVAKTASATSALDEASARFASSLGVSH